LSVDAVHETVNDVAVALGKKIPVGVLGALLSPEGVAGDVVVVGVVVVVVVGVVVVVVVVVGGGGGVAAVFDVPYSDRGPAFPTYEPVVQVCGMSVRTPAFVSTGVPDPQQKSR